MSTQTNKIRIMSALNYFHRSGEPMAANMLRETFNAVVTADAAVEALDLADSLIAIHGLDCARFCRIVFGNGRCVTGVA